ncbi:MarR family winged helix-turn-helix transcriptional regulator [Kineococcus sp. SYSU DK003]|uniref:MarR family winged helix-turn-helix transcriptional regulator n=1 Tax=Kineococcus sp. SYSU DK003 TaxID=3383124 RepID=UPI003D7D2928
MTTLEDAASGSQPAPSAVEPAPSAVEPAPSAVEPAPSAGLLADLEAEFAALWQLRKVRAREFAGLLHPHLDPTALPLLGELGTGGPLRPTEIAERLHLDPSTVSRQLAATEKLGLVVRVPDPRDARARLVDLTPQARGKFTAYRRELLARWRSSLGAWDPGEVETLTKLLHRVRQDW